MLPSIGTIAKVGKGQKFFSVYLSQVGHLYTTPQQSQLPEARVICRYGWSGQLDAFSKYA